MSVLGHYLDRIKRMTRRSDPITSIQAAEAAEKHINRTARNVLAYARTVGERGFTDLEMEAFLGDKTSNSRSRRRELVDKGLIVDTGNRCECTGHCGLDHGGRCEALNGEPHPTTISKVVLTVMHLDHQPENNADDNLMHGCQQCHNRYDAPMRRAGIKERARAQCAAGDLFKDQPA